MRVVSNASPIPIVVKGVVAMCSVTYASTVKMARCTARAAATTHPVPLACNAVTLAEMTRVNAA